MNTVQTEQFVNIKLYDFMRCDPSAIRSIFADPFSNRLYIARQTYSEVYQISIPNQSKPIIQQIAELQPCLYLLHIGNCLVMFKPFQLKLFHNGRWQYLSFTTQLLDVRVEGDTVYSFHEKQSISWHFSETSFSYSYLNEHNTPYHLDSAGYIVGMGKRIQSMVKGIKLTTCAAIPNKWFIAGDEKGGIYIYDWKLLAHVKSFHQHQGPILSIKVDIQTNTVYFTGSDSKVGVIRLIGDDWKAGNSCRGQSHDVFSLQLFGNYLISGGITTDLCFYDLIDGQLSGNFTHKISYCSTNRISVEGRYVVVNNRSSFQIWQINNSLVRTKLLVKYDMPTQKFIVSCKLYHEPLQEKTLLLVVVTDEDTVGWKFNNETGLTKYITIQNQYVLTELLAKHVFLGVRSDGLIERVNCRTGKIEELTYCEIEHPTDLLLLGSGLVVVGSKLTHSLNLLNIKSKELVKQIHLKETYTYIEHIEGNELLVQYFNNSVLFKLTLENQKQEQVVQLPVSIIRFGGWLNSVSRGDGSVKTRAKKYWYGVSEGKIVIIPNLQKDGQKKIRVKQTDRIAQVIRCNGKQLGCNLAIVPYNFTRMVDQMPLKPIFTKKIL